MALAIGRWRDEGLAWFVRDSKTHGPETRSVARRARESAVRHDALGVVHAIGQRFGLAFQNAARRSRSSGPPVRASDVSRALRVSMRWVSSSMSQRRVAAIASVGFSARLAASSMAR